MYLYVKHINLIDSTTKKEQVNITKAFSTPSLSYYFNNA